MAKKKTNTFPGISVPLMEEEVKRAQYLYDIYVDQLAISANMETKQLQKMNYQGLFELGCHTPCPLVSKLLKDGSNLACNLIVAHGYVSYGF